ncbi:hypothetical protein VST7929_02795 [Vibrio stylophorae]|uniref:diguanylate cyclase n=2 Tax=Vibrio stylophorae TaxID=659351 RepID=A0ABN8DW46_9VIBR|nr:hypothetical protein VST7929_02795 [Vibrio stylophorae]
MICHLVLLLTVVLALSFLQYKQSMARHIETTTRHKVELVLGLRSFYSFAIARNEYQNTQSPLLLQYLKTQSSLKWLVVRGTSDDGVPFESQYIDEHNRIIRTFYPSNFLQRLKKLKISARTRQREEYELAKTSRIQMTPILQKIRFQQGVFYDQSNALLYVKINTDNLRGGAIYACFDVSHLETEDQEIAHLIVEQMVMLAITLIILSLLLSYLLTRPLTRLAALMSHDISKIDAPHLPGLNRNDEIGQITRQFSNLILRVQRQVSELSFLGSIDSLTSLYNHGQFDQALNDIAQHHQRRAGLILFDLDKFKHFNDSYGHPAGDRALVQIAQTTRYAVRGQDRCFRIGGEEFAVILQSCDEYVVRDVAHRLLDLVEGLAIAHADNGTSKNVVTISIGYLFYDPAKGMQTATELYQRCDQALYRAKKQGRHQAIQAD